MKKLIFVFAIASLFAFQSSGQKFRFGLKGGLNLPSAEAYNFDPSDEATGWHAGLFASIRIAKFGIQPELQYSYVQFSNDNAELDYAWGAVPVMLKYYIIKGLNVQVGPQFSYLITSDFESGGNTQDNTDLLKDTDVSIGIGAGFELPFGLDVHARYLIGVTDIADDPTIGEINTSTFQVSVGLALIKLGLL